jgi:peptidoglycan/LPS O-acetylase OafA/YrhL
MSIERLTVRQSKLSSRSVEKCAEFSSVQLDGRIANGPDLRMNASARFVHLDMLRGLAALGVVLGHARGFIVVQYSVAHSDSFAVQLFYFMTGLGHQCVMAFFALSGYLVGGQALRHILAGQFCCSQYFVRRLSRLWTVLIPALFLTLGFDVAGQMIAGPAGYEGQFFNLIFSGPQTHTPADLSISTFVANLLFLQTIIAPAFGSNGPLWSLANEFWYYLIFPFVAEAVFGESRAVTRAILGCIGVVIAILLPRDMLLLGSIWVAGALANYVAGRLSHPLRIRTGALPLLTVSGGVILCISIILDKIRPGLASDVVLGCAFAGVLPVLSRLPDIGKIYDTVARGLANISYTLYATHFPVLAFIWFVALAPRKLPLEQTAILLMTAIGTAALAVAVVMWWFFERNTDTVRRVLERWLWTGVRITPRNGKNPYTIV